MIDEAIAILQSVTPGNCENLNRYGYGDCGAEEIIAKALAVLINVPDGWKLVPIEPSLEMVMVGETAHDRQLEARLDASPRKAYPSEETAELCCRASYRAMINAAPPPQEGKSE